MSQEHYPRTERAKAGETPAPEGVRAEPVPHDEEARTPADETVPDEAADAAARDAGPAGDEVPGGSPVERTGGATSDPTEPEPSSSDPLRRAGTAGDVEAQGAGRPEAAPVEGDQLEHLADEERDAS